MSRLYGPEVIQDGDTWLVYGAGPAYLLSQRSPHFSFRDAFAEACDLAGWDTQHVFVVGPPRTLAEEVLT